MQNKPLSFSKRNLFALLLTLICTSLPAYAADSSQPGELINQRLGWMKDVAGSKAANHQPVEDLAQEKKVMASTLQLAQSQGIAPDSIKPFIQAQMDVAKAIQYRYRADWLSTPEKGWHPRPLDEVRTKISQLSTQIVEKIAQDLKAGAGHFPPAEAAFTDSLQQKNLKPADKQLLYKTLIQTHLSQ
ncbi:hypothetical protein BTJ39_14225 [Izhakiella australiensis]|uniref:Chorismate mutase n=1 Tax=Izhakiella australiensis TaxID=1926881 RepID=A0A1S8YKH3_9GAMM|nr:chorismate mutase [Izhakiella australiensis]OON39432.1 hypothetical protein BTJ39_14225 [Izhakiella australiensis]